MLQDSTRPAAGSPYARRFERDCSIMRRMAEGDATALDEVLKEHWTAVVEYAMSFVRVREAGEDIAQETMLRLWRHREQWAPTATLRVYLLRIARNLSLNEIDRGRVRVRARAELELGWTRPPTPLEELQRQQLRLAVEAAVDGLPKRRREVFILGRLHGLSYKEIGHVMGIAPQTVANQMTAALTELREVLADLRER